MGTRRERRSRVVVLDTNVLVSALGWPGPERRVYEHCRARVLHQAISPDLLHELERVLRYPKFHFTDLESRSFLRDVISSAQLVEPTQSIDAVHRDPDDNRVLGCAVVSGAEWIVSGDAHLLELREYGGIQILTAVEALRPLPS